MKKACFKKELVEILSRCKKKEERLVAVFENFDEIYEDAKLSYDRFVSRNSADKLSARLQKETFNFLERSQQVLELIKAEALILATNILGVSFLDFKTFWCFKNLSIMLSILFINIVFNIILGNGKDVLKDLNDQIDEQKKSVSERFGENFKPEIERAFKVIETNLRKVKCQITAFIVLLWGPFVFMSISILVRHFVLKV